LRTPYWTPTVNTIAERWVGSVWRECLDRLLIVSETHLRYVLTRCIQYDNEARLHGGLDQRTRCRVSRVAGRGQSGGTTGWLGCSASTSGTRRRAGNLPDGAFERHTGYGEETRCERILAPYAISVTLEEAAEFAAH
jgi:hypothetical protein